MSKVILDLLLLAISLSLANSADIVARVPSDYPRGVKWILFRDDSIPDPPPNVIQAEDGVQVLPTYRYHAHQQPPQYHSYDYTPHVSAATPVHVPLQLPVHAVHHNQPLLTTPAPRFNSEVIGGSAQDERKPLFHFGQAQVADHQQEFDQHFQHRLQEIDMKALALGKFSSFGVTAVPHSAVHVTSPAYLNFLRKKKND